MFYSVKMRRKFGPLKFKNLLKPLMTLWLIFGLFSLHIAPEFLHNLVHILESTHHEAPAKETNLKKGAAFQSEQEFCKFHSLLASHLNNHTLISDEPTLFDFSRSALHQDFKFESISIPLRLHKQNSARAPPAVV